MMVRIGNFLFHYRNGLFPLAYLLLFVQGRRVFEEDWVAAAGGFAVAMAGQILRVVTIGLAYIIRGGRRPPGLRGRLGDGGPVQSLP